MTDEILNQLAAPFPPDRVSWRVGPTTQDKTKGQALAYIDARDVMARLDEVVGAGMWASELIPMWPGAVSCRLSICIDGQWVTKSDMAGATGDIENEKEREMAVKGAGSDSLKRAAVQWGVGRYLYDLECPWVDLDERKRIKPHEMKRLRDLLPGAAVAKPKAASRQTYSTLSTGLKQCASLGDLAAFWREKAAEIKTLPDDWQRDLTTEKNDLKAMWEARTLESAE